MTTLRDAIDTLHAAGATDVTVHPDGRVTATFLPTRETLEQRWDAWRKGEADRQLNAALTQGNAQRRAPAREDIDSLHASSSAVKALWCATSRGGALP